MKYLFFLVVILSSCTVNKYYVYNCEPAKDSIHIAGDNWFYHTDSAKIKEHISNVFLFDNGLKRGY